MTKSFDQDPAAALDAVRRAQGSAVGRVAHGSLAYDLIYSLLVGGLVASMALPRPFTVGGSLICTFGLVGLMRIWANRSGVWVGGLTPKRARWVSIGLGAVLLALAMSALVLREQGRPLLGLALAPVGFIAALLASRLWMTVYRSEAGGGA